MVKVAVNDRNALVALGVPRADADKMSHAEVVAALKKRGYDWKKSAPRLNGHY